AAEAVLLRRYWCKYACPVGSTLGLLQTRWTLRIDRDASRCTCPSGAEACHLVCPLGRRPPAEGTHPYCYNCGECLAACEKVRRGALQLTIGRRAPQAEIITVVSSQERVL